MNRAGSLCRIIAVFFAVAVVFIGFLDAYPPAAESGSGLKLAVSEIKADTGDQVIIEISATGAAGSEGGEFILSFNPELVKPLKVEPGELINSAANLMEMGNPEYDYGRLRYMWITAHGDTADAGIVCMITFELLDEGVTVVELSDIVASPAGFAVALPAAGNIVIGDLEVADYGNNTEQNGAADDEEPEEQLSDELLDNEQAGEAENNGETAEDEAAEDEERFNYLLYLALPVVIIAAAIRIVFLKRIKDAKKMAEEKKKE